MMNILFNGRSYKSWRGNGISWADIIMILSQYRLNFCMCLCLCIWLFGARFCITRHSNTWKTYHKNSLLLASGTKKTSDIFFFPSLRMETSSVQLKLANQSVAPLRSRLPTPAVWCVKVVQLLPAVQKKTKKRVSFQLGLEYFVVLGLSERMADLFPVLKSAQMQS